MISKGLQHPSYGLVVSLIIYWENGNPGFKEEGEKLGCFFRDRLGYVVKIFAIPRNDSHIKLLCFITNAIKETHETMEARGCPALIILHYGGHGDPYDNRRIGQQEQLVWAEYVTKNPRELNGFTNGILFRQEKGATIVKWFEIQRHLQYAKSDVLLVLDCCFALRASQQQLTPQSEINPTPSYQLLAAASHREPTPLPGPQSFTNALLRRLEEHFPGNCHSHGTPLAITDLIRDIQTIQGPSLLIPPSHHSFTNGTIVIGPTPKLKNRETENERRRDGDTLTVRIRTPHRMTNKDVTQFTRHMTLDSPDFVESAELLEVSSPETSKMALKSNGVSRTSSTPNRAVWNQKSMPEGDEALGYRYGGISSLREGSARVGPILVYPEREILWKSLSRATVYLALCITWLYRVLRGIFETLLLSRTHEPTS